MPSIEKKAIRKQVNYIKNKFKNVKEETESVVSVLHNCLNVFDHRIEELVGCEVEHFTTLYRKLNKDFEDFQENLMYIEASIELPSNCEIISKKPSTDCENELQIRPESKSSSHINSKPTDLQTSSPRSCSSHVFPTENVTTSLNLGNVTEFISPSRLISYPSVDNLGRAATNASPQTFFKNDEAELTENATSFVLPTTTSVAETFSASFQNNVNSSKSTLYASLNDIEDSGVNNCTPVSNKINTAGFPQNAASKKSEDAFQLEQISNHLASIESLSQTSCHLSLSSNLSDYQSACSGQDSGKNSHVNTPSIQNKSEISANQTILKRRIISSVQINCPVTVTATITHIENPGNFWMKLDNCENSKLCFPKKMFLKSVIPTSVEVGDFFLFPSKSVSYYLRVKVIAVDENDDHVKVFFIDHGPTQVVPKKELRVLPCEAYEIPMQAINCTLADISAPNNIWCYAAIQKFKEFSTSSVEANIKCQIGDKYAVQLIASVCDFTCDIAQSLCYDGFATEDDTASGKSASDLCDNNISSMQTSNQLSSDSGVSVTSNQPSSPINQSHHYSSEILNSPETKHRSQLQNELQELCSERLVFQELASEKNVASNAVDLISFESTELLQNEYLTVPEEDKDTTFTEYNKCLKIGTCKCPLHLLIPLPSLKFVKQHMVLVMFSHIAHPNNFYVNLAMESSDTLDELFEQMFNVYSPQTAQDTYSILLDDLKVGMFCVAWFNDGNWYRVKVLDIHHNFDQSHNVLVQYVDYGNEAWVKNTDLRTLTQEFAKHPALSVKCSLACVVPAKQSDCYNDDTSGWNKEAVDLFKSMISFEKCYTAQICDRTTILDDDPLQILLWDKQEENDVNINNAFVDSKLAMFDLSAVEKLLHLQNKKKADVENLSRWNPMFDEFHNIQNSYGVNFDDFQVATDGYKYKDEEYICKYYSLRGGYCPRNPCPYLHVPLAEGGVTRDKDELYSFNCYPPLPQDGSSFLVQVSAVISPSFFYVQLPFGNLTVDQLDSQINQGIPRESLQNQELNDLFNALNERYTNKPFDETTTIGLAYGTIVVARRLYDQTWHRARIIDGQDIDKPAKVFYVDFGNEEWVDRRNIRRISPEFLHAPFQAVECCLYDVEPLGFEKGHKWSSYAVNCFKDLVSETIMLAHVAYKFNDTLQISLRRTTQNDHLTIKEHLISQGFGQEKLLVKTNKPSSKYIPG